MLLRQLLEDRHCRYLCTIESRASLEDAIEEMASKKVSALIVLKEDRPAGILAEGDILKCHLKDRAKPFTEISVETAMTERLIVAEADEPVHDAMSAMIQSDIRHLPVMDGRKIAGVLTMNDLVKHQIGSLTAEIHYLQDYITDLQNAVHD